MRKIMVLGAAGILTFVMGTAVFAPADLMQAEARTRACTFVDRNHDGFCDRGDIHTHSGRHVDANHDGICDKGDHFCMQYTDTNRDGICDHCSNACNHRSTSSSSHHSSHHSGHHH